MASPSFEVNQAELAWMLGVSPKTVQQWDGEGLAEAARKGMDGREAKYDPRKAVAWKEKRDQERREQASTAAALDEAKLQKEQLEVRRRQIDVARAEGEVISVEDHRAVVERIGAAFRTAVLGVPGSWGPQVVGIMTAAEGTEAMRTCSEELLRDLKSTLTDELQEERPGSDPLPDDFPGRKELADAGITTWGELRELDDWQSVYRIGPKKAEQMALYLQEDAA